MNKKFTIIESRNKGLFSNVLHTLLYVDWSYKEGRIPITDWKIYFYLKNFNDNVWDYYFEPVSEYKISDITKEDDVIECCGKWARSAFVTKNIGSPETGSRIFINKFVEKYLKIKPYILEKINNFYALNMQNSNIIGVHLRNKVFIDPAYGKRIDFIKEYLSKNPTSKIFIATESTSCIDMMVKEFGDKIIYYPCNREAMVDNTELNNYDLDQLGSSKIKEHPWNGEDSIIDCILLSKCNFLLHGHSNLTTFCLYFNPNIEHVYIQEKRHKFWKDQLTKERQREIGYRQ